MAFAAGRLLSEPMSGPWDLLVFHTTCFARVAATAEIVSHSTKQRNLSDKTWVPGEGTGCGERQNKLSSLHFSSKKDPLPHQYRIQAPCISSKQNPISEKIKRKGGIHTDG